jgi:hypothetical protein
MTQLEKCIGLINNENCGIMIERYPQHKITIFSFVKIINEKERTIYFECAYDIAKLLIKNKAKIHLVKNNCVALNFTPEKTKKGMMTYCN